MRQSLRATIRSNIVSRKAANAAIKGADLAERAMTVVERAYLFGGLANLAADEAFNISFSVSVMNAGRTPGRIRSIRFGVFAIPIEENFEMAVLADYSAAKEYTTDSIMPPTAQEPIFNVVDMPIFGVAYGIIEYDDIFKARHYSRFCIRYNGIAKTAVTFGNDAWNEYD